MSQRWLKGMWVSIAESLEYDGKNEVYKECMMINIWKDMKNKYFYCILFVAKKAKKLGGTKKHPFLKFNACPI